MKKNIFYILIGLLWVGILSNGCKKDGTNDLIQENGLTRDINDFIPQNILDILDSLGMPIHTGGNPTNIKGTFNFSPPILMSSNIIDDPIGNKFEDVILSFSDQDNKKLTLITKYTQVQQESDGYGSFIVGEGNDFTVFTKIKTVDKAYNDSALTTQIYSGTMTATGIEYLYLAAVMLDNYGNPNNNYIEVGEARVIYDEDGFSERTVSEKSGVKMNGTDDSHRLNLLESINR